MISELSRIPRSPLYVALAALTIGAFAPACSSSPPGPSPAAFSVDGLPQDLATRALEHVVASTRDGLTPGWAGAELAHAQPLFRPDVDGAAYYELEVRAKGEPAGFLVLSTGDHDDPIVQFHDAGAAPTAILRALAANGGVAISRFLLVGSDYYAEGDDGTLIGASGPVERSEVLDAEVPAELAQYRDQQKAASKTKWRVLADDERRQRDPAFASAHALDHHYLDGDGATFNRCAPFRGDPAQYRACTDTPAPDANCFTQGEMPHYRQLAPGEGQNTHWFKSGCGPTAWAVLIGWASNRGFDGDPEWAPFRMLYRGNGLTQPLKNSPVVRAPMWWGGGGPPPAGKDLFYFHGPWDLERLTMAINDHVGTYGNPVTSGGATTPSEMANLNDYLRDVGIPSSSMNVSDDTIGGAHTDAIKASAIRYLCTYQVPVVVGIDDLRHYPIVDHYYKRGGSEYFWMNQNSPSYWNVGWLSKDFFYAGTILPKSAPPGIHVLNATYGANAGQPFGNATVGLVKSCEGKTSCGFSIDPYKLGTAPQTDFNAAYTCGADTTIKRVTWTGGSAAGTVALSCPSGTGTYADPPPISPDDRTLTVRRSGSGRVVGGGIDCGSRCSATYPRGTQITLTATPDAGQTFQGWTGGVCYGTGPCTVTVDIDKTATAIFSTPVQYESLSVTRVGNGRVTASSGGIDCGAQCTGSYAQGTPVTLTATADPGWIFTGWSGACTGGACSPVMDAQKSVTATFAPAPPSVHTLTLTVVQGGLWPPGSGDVTSTPAGIACHLDVDQTTSTCSGSFPAGSVVTLGAQPLYPSRFDGFGGACSGSTCSVTVDGDKAVSATFQGQIF